MLGDVAQGETRNQLEPDFSKGTPMVSHFWVSCYPFFESTLFLMPPASAYEELGHTHEIEVYDPDGALVNQARFIYPPVRMGLVELKMLMGACKLESGIKHAHVIVKSPEGSQHICRIQTSEKAAVLGQPLLISDLNSTFYPVMLAEDRASYIALINHANTEAVVRCRLFFGRRTPEVEVVLPAQGARLIGIEDAFLDQAALSEGKRVQAYVRLGTKGATPVGALLVEQVKILNDKEFYSSVC